MSFLSIFSENLLLLRHSHSLTLSELALLINQNNSAVIKRWESQKNWPSMDVMLLISRLFGVSLDWLLGNTDYPYNEELILSIENELIPAQVHLEQDHVSVFNPFGFPEAYYNAQLRKETYSLPVRANLLFLMRHEAMYMAYTRHHQCYSNPTPLKTSLKINYCQSYADKEILENAKERYEYYLNMYSTLLYKGKEATPIFNILKP